MEAGMSDNVQLVLQFLVCPQNDFIGIVGQDGTDGTCKLHVGEDAVRKLRGDGRPGSDPFVDTVSRFFDDRVPGAERLRVVIDEDWHSEGCEEFGVFGKHCLKGTLGAQLPGGLEARRYHNRCRFIRANSICVASDPRYWKVLAEVCWSVKADNIRVGVLGVWTHVKVEYLLVGLNSFWPHVPFGQMAVCEPLCASPDQGLHEAAVRKLESFSVRVIRDREEYCRDWLKLGP